MTLQHIMVALAGRTFVEGRMPLMYQYMRYPPLAQMHCPVIQLLSSLAIQATTWAMSFGVPMRRSMGVRSASKVRSSAFVEAASRSDRVEPGEMVLTVTPRSPSSAAHERVKASMANFEEV